MTPTLYLAGPITGLSYGGATDWRDGAKAALAPDIAGLSPMRGKHYLLNEAAIGDSYEASLLSSARSITARDRFDVMRSDAVLFNFLGVTKAAENARVSIGSCIEIGWADAFRKPAILVMEPDAVNLHDHAMVRQICGWQVATLDEGLAVARAILLP